MIGYPAALEIVLAAARALPRRTVPSARALGLAAAAEVRSAVAVPSFDNAAMDGFALRGDDSRGATPGTPVRLRVLGRIAAGEPASAPTPAGCAWEIMTGARLPADCDAVVPIERAAEQIVAGERLIELREALAPGHNRRRAGEDFQPGTILLREGDPVTAEALMALAAIGCDELTVHARPRIAVITTGSELVSHGPPGALTIRDTNGPYLDASLRSLGFPVSGSSVSDDPEGLASAIESAAAGSDIVLTTGGVSAGRFDHVPATVARLGGEILLHGVAIRPGKPLLCARLPAGQILFGLPGNPMAVAVGLRFFVLPALRALTGRTPEAYPVASAAGRIRKRPALTFFAKAHARITPEATLEVSLLPGQESFRIAPLLHANCWAIVPEGIEDLAPGALVQVAPLAPGEFPAT